MQEFRHDALVAADDSASGFSDDAVYYQNNTAFSTRWATAMFGICLIFGMCLSSDILLFLLVRVVLILSRSSCLCVGMFFFFSGVLRFVKAKRQFAAALY